jgi:hypothetical protein
MADATTLTEFQHAWQDFLLRIERAWEMAERQLRGQAGFQQWSKPYSERRKKDPLLQFLHQARHAETHGISDTVGKPLELLLRDKYGRKFDFRGARGEFKDGVLTIDLQTQHPAKDLDISVVPTNPILVRFKNRGKWYNPPTSHLGNRLTDVHPVEAARLGLAFYRTFIGNALGWFTREKASRG